MATSQEQQMRRALGFDLAQAAIRAGATPPVAATPAVVSTLPGCGLPPPDPTLPSSVTLGDDGKLLVIHRQTSLLAGGATGSVHVYDSLWGHLALR